VSAKSPRRARRQLPKTRPAAPSRRPQRPSGKPAPSPAIADQEAPAELIGASPAIQDVRARILTLVRPGGERPNVLLEGEAGTGKSLVASLLHRLGRPQAPVVIVDCAAAPETYLRETLFGVPPEDSQARPWLQPGLLELVTGGTIVLEEVCGLPKALQAMLVKALGPRPPGSRRAQAVPPWVIGTCNSDMDAAVRMGHVREDLFRQLAGVRIVMPPLRECGDDAVIIANWLLPRICGQHHRPLMTLAPEVGQRFLEYGWPGSVRELTHMLTRAVLLSTSSVISAEELW
jgi:DNA-binding NtrC family response regulator